MASISHPSGRNIMSFQPPGSLAGTLAAYERRRSSLEKQPLAQEFHSQEDFHQEAPASDAIYQRALPSLHMLRWRPMYHLQAPMGWMNDPCAPAWDPATSTYHLSFQWNPKRNVYGKIAWDNISWGHSTSKDLIHWTVSSATLIKPGAWYDAKGCFTGCMVPTGLDGSLGTLTIFYTGVSRLPLHYTLPYVNQTETLNIAQSQDGGSTWRKYRANPITPEPPAGVSVSGWRDPFVMPWPSIDKILGREGEKNLYGVISGGIKGQTPTAFLYAVNKQNLPEWIYMSSLMDLGLNHNISRWSGDLGINWECANFVTLADEQDSIRREFIIVGCEGADMMHPNSTFAEYPQEETKFPRAERSLQWMCGSLYTETNDAGSLVPKMKYECGGRFDHGCMYGVNSFYDPVTSKQVAFGWITEEDLPQELVDRQNWSGMMSLPRELNLITLRGVTGALVSKLPEITSIELTPESENSFVVRTLGMRAAAHVADLRQGTREVPLQGLPELTNDGSCGLDVQTCRFEVAADLAVADGCSRIGLTIYHNQDHDINQATSVHLTVSTETITIERPDSSQVDSDILTFTEKAPFTLFSFADGSRERLQIRAWFDESVLEVFVNDRCTFATRIYPATKRCWGIKFWAEDEGPLQSKVVEARAWDGLRADIRVAT
jgi:beta-fructofuranosidase